MQVKKDGIVNLFFVCCLLIANPLTSFGSLQFAHPLTFLLLHSAKPNLLLYASFCKHFC
jgi:hypothetical protein